MIIFYSAILYTIQLIVQHCNCLNLIDLPQGREVFTAKWKLASRAPEMYEPYPRRREIKTYFRRYMLDNDRPGDKLHLKASRRVYEDEKDDNLKKKIDILVKQTVSDTEDKIKDLDAMKIQHAAEPSYKAGFVLSMMKKSREVVNELFNLAVKHRDEWQALEQLKIFEMIVNTNVDTNNYLKQLKDIQASGVTNFVPSPTKSIYTGVQQYHDTTISGIETTDHSETTDHRETTDHSEATDHNKTDGSPARYLTF